jgi:hypothetical protein
MRVVREASHIEDSNVPNSPFAAQAAPQRQWGYVVSELLNRDEAWS